MARRAAGSLGWLMTGCGFFAALVALVTNTSEANALACDTLTKVSATVMPNATFNVVGVSRQGSGQVVLATSDLDELDLPTGRLVIGDSNAAPDGFLLGLSESSSVSWAIALDPPPLDGLTFGFTPLAVSATTGGANVLIRSITPGLPPVVWGDTLTTDLCPLRPRQGSGVAMLRYGTNGYLGHQYVVVGLAEDVEVTSSDDGAGGFWIALSVPDSTSNALDDDGVAADLRTCGAQRILRDTIWRVHMVHVTSSGAVTEGVLPPPPGVTHSRIVSLASAPDGSLFGLGTCLLPSAANSGVLIGEIGPTGWASLSVGQLSPPDDQWSFPVFFSRVAAGRRLVGVNFNMFASTEFPGLPPVDGDRMFWFDRQSPQLRFGGGLSALASGDTALIARGESGFVRVGPSGQCEFIDRFTGEEGIAGLFSMESSGDSVITIVEGSTFFPTATQAAQGLAYGSRITRVRIGEGAGGVELVRVFRVNAENGALRSGRALTDALLEQNSSGRFVEYVGAVADGASDLWVCATGSESAGGACNFAVPAGDGALYGAEGTLGPVQALQAEWVRGSDGKDYGWARYSPPRVFDRGTGDYGLRSRSVNLSVLGGDRSLTWPLELHRAPVILVHGFGLAGPQSWKPEWWADRYPAFDFRKADLDAVRPVAFCAARLRLFVQEQRQDYERRLVACEEVDIVTQSMGALFARRAIADGETRVRRLVCIGGTHLGTEIANLGMAFLCTVDNSVKRDRIAKIFKAFGRDPMGGAFADLQEGSSASLQLPPCTALAYVIATKEDGVAARVPGIIDGIIAGLLHTLWVPVLESPPPGFDQLPEPTREKVRRANLGLLPFSMSFLFDDAPNDGWVSECSQIGGCTAGEMLPGNISHLRQKETAAVVDRTIELLRVGDTQMGFLPRPLATPCPNPDAVSQCAFPASASSAAAASSEEKLQIEAAPNPLLPGQSLNVTVRGINGFSPTKVLAYVPGCGEMSDTVAPFEFVCTTPVEDEESGVRVIARGLDEDTGQFEVLVTSLWKSPAGQLAEVTVRPDSVTMGYPGARHSIEVTGSYDSGHRESLGLPHQGTRYETDNALVAEVTEYGSIIARAPGMAHITVRQGDFVKVVPITVSGEYGGCLLTSGCVMTRNALECRTIGGSFNGQGSVCDDVTTPVHMARFAATRQGRSVRVEWELGDGWSASTFDVLRRTLGSSAWESPVAEGMRGGPQFSYVDELAPAGRLEYGLREMRAGSETIHGPVEVAGVVVENDLRVSFSAAGARMVGIRFGLDRAAKVRLSVYDATGRIVRTLADERMEAGEHRSDWDLRDNGGRISAPGVYFVSLLVDGERLAKKAVLTR